MIRLRASIEWSLERRWLRIVILSLLALLLVLGVLHICDEILEVIVLTCLVALPFGLRLRARCSGVRMCPYDEAARRGRAPPAVAASALLRLTPFSSGHFAPLRL